MTKITWHMIGILNCLIVCQWSKIPKREKKVNQRIYKVNGPGFPNFDYGGSSKRGWKAS